MYVFLPIYQEHEAFLQGLKEYGREWKRVAEKIKTRTSAQIRSHAQKYFARLAKRKRSDKVVHRTKGKAVVTISCTHALHMPYAAAHYYVPMLIRPLLYFDADRDMKETEELLGMVQSMLDALKHHRQVKNP